MAPDARAALADPDRWDEAAPALIEAGDASALPALVDAYDAPADRSRAVLIRAMTALGGAEAAAGFAASEEAGDRYIGARLMQLVPDERHLPQLERLVVDSAPRVATAARRALASQERTPAWYETVERLRSSSDAELAAAAEEWLEQSRRPPGIYTGETIFPP